MINQEIIKAKLNIIRDNLVRIKEILEDDDKMIKGDDKSRSAMERYFQLIVDAAVSINEHIISENQLEIPNDYFSTFIILGKNNILPKKFSEAIAPSVGLRNKLIHMYEKVEPDLALKYIRENIHQYDEYLSYIVSYCGLK